jgi:hypothetical protein
MFLSWDYTLEYFFWVLVIAVFMISLTILLSKSPKPASPVKPSTIHSHWNLDENNTLYDIEINQGMVLVVVWIFFIAFLLIF